MKLTYLVSVSCALAASWPFDLNSQDVARLLTPVVTQESESLELQVAEYIRRYPYQQTYDYGLRYTGGDPAKLNTWLLGGEPVLVRAGDDIVPRTNNDTFYQAATVWLADGLVVVLSSDAPSKDRFSSFQLGDDRNANYRNILYPKGKYTLYFGEKPARFEGEAIEVPSRLSVVLVRVEVKDKNNLADVAGAKAVLNGMTVTGSRPADFPRVDLLSEFSADVAAEAHRRMDQVFATTPISQMIVGPGQEPGRDVPYLFHAAVTKGAYGGPDPAHSAYEAIFVDRNGRELMGRNGTYTVTTEEPPVDAFWSVTVYDSERGGFLHPNRNDRYHINNTSAIRNANGTVTFTFKQACEAEDLNCLEVPSGRFDIATRYFLPHEEIISGAWTFPGVGLIAE